jgi:hypothetical protein
MSKKQLILTSLVAAIPAGFLLFVLGMAAMNHGSGVFSGLKWAPWGLAALCGAIAAVIPVLIMLFPAISGAATAGAASSAAALGGNAASPDFADSSLEPSGFGADDDMSDDGGSDDDAGSDDDGEQLFDDEALDSDDDTEFAGFDDDDDDKR